MARKGVMREYYFIHYLNSGQSVIKAVKHSWSKPEGNVVFMRLGSFSTGRPPRIEAGAIVIGNRKYREELLNIKEALVADKIMKVFDKSNSV